MFVIGTVELTIEKAEHLPMPLVYLATADDLARWLVDQLRWTYEQGERSLRLSLFDTAGMGFDLVDAAPVVLRAVMSFVRKCGDIESLAVFCGDELSFQAYSRELVKYTAVEQ